MDTYILVAIGSMFLTVCWKIDAHVIIKHAIVSKYIKWKRLNRLVSKIETDNIRVIWISLKILLRTLYVAFIQYINNSVRQLDNKTSEITYVINGKMYKMIVIPKRGPNPILQISNDLENDVTDLILPYMGPQYDWHGSIFKPEFFGYKSLTFELGDGTEHTYDESDNVEYIRK
jgi:hypothetical protein